MFSPSRARAIFDSLILSFPPETTIAYTDGSLSSEKKNMHVPYSFPHSESPNHGSSIVSAELHGIEAALSYAYNCDALSPEICIVTDSSSAIKAIASPNFAPTNDCVMAIRNNLECLKSGGTKVYLAWVPSHVGIQGNERADELASLECKFPSGNQIANKVSAPEKQAEIRQDWPSELHINLK